jgi:hypothetical protein
VPGPQFQEASREQVVVAISAGQGGQVAQRRDRLVIVAGFPRLDEVRRLLPGRFGPAIEMVQALVVDGGLGCCPAFLLRAPGCASASSRTVLRASAAAHNWAAVRAGEPVAFWVSGPPRKRCSRRAWTCGPSPSATMVRSLSLTATGSVAIWGIIH